MNYKREPQGCGKALTNEKALVASACGNEEEDFICWPPSIEKYKEV